LLLIDASERGSGKTLLADTIGLIASGRTLPRRTMPETPEEWKKSILAIAIAADPVILIDNVTRQLRSDALDAVLTGTSYRERVLGRNEELTLDVRTLFIATANNASLSPDLVRRALHIRLEGDTERPEARSGFAHPDLRAHILEKRADYLRAALTIVRGYFVAGCPDMKLRPMGSFEAWSKVVRNALVWAGQADPLETQEALRETSDPEQEAMEQLLTAWHLVYGERSVTVRNVLADLADPHDPRERELMSAVSVFCDTDPGKLPSPRKLGNKLRSLRGRITKGLRFERASDSSKEGVAWRTKKVSQ
jgi:putative DNA primase/helicase